MKSVRKFFDLSIVVGSFELKQHRKQEFQLQELVILAIPLRAASSYRIRNERN